jgi:glucose/arabinose dehydrogenase
MLVFSSCNNDGGSDTIMDDDGESMEEAALGLVNAFPQLSFSQPLDLQSPDDGTNRIFVAEKGGRIRVFTNEPTVNEDTVFLDLSANLSTVSEQGLLGLAFHPNYQSNGFFYVYYTPTAGLSQVSRFTVSANAAIADAASELVLLEIPQPATNHNGGQIAFGPDGYLYIALGDGGGGGDPFENGQDRSTLLGSILRIDVDSQENGLNYSIPTDNPFIGEPNVREEIYAYGLRNPWRMSFDTQTGELWTGDVGQNAIEEIDVVVSGGNYGWPIFEGTRCFSGDCNDTGLIDPIFEYAQDNGDRSITGGFVYRGTTVPSLQGKYIYGDFVSGRIWALELDGTLNELVEASRLNIASFGTDTSQELYVCAFDGSIYKFQEN